MKILLLNFYCLPVLLIGLFNLCNQNFGKEKLQVKVTGDAITNQPDTSFYVKDSNLYSRQFLEKLKASGYALKYSIIDGMIIINDADTAWFPVYLPLNKNVELGGKIKEKSILLSVQRKNYTTISFELKIFGSGQLIDEQSGEADIGILFFLGAESDQDDKTGIGYFSSEYYKKDVPCELAIRIGSDHDQLKTKLNRKCSDKKKSIDLEDCPTLRRIK